MKFKFVIAVAVCMGILVALAGCGSNGKQWKQDVLNAIEMNKSMNNYTFSGSANLELPSFTNEPPATALPVPSDVLSMLTNSQIAWSGTANREPVRLEANLEIGQKGEGPALGLPVILKDNKMYFQIPGVNQEDDFFEIDMDELSRMSNQANPLSPQMLKNTWDATTTIMRFVIESVDPKWFTRDKETVSIELNQENIGEISRSLFDKLPSAADELQKNGLITADQANQFKQMADDQALQKLQSALAQTKIEQPGKISVTINDSGYIVEQHIDLDYTMQADTTKAYHIHIESKTGQINQNPEFKQPIPEHARSFNEVLQLLNSMKP